MVLHIVFLVVGLLVGAIAGLFGGAYYVRKKFEDEQLSEKQIQIMAKQMGRNLNQKQLAQISRQMKAAKDKDKQKVKRK